MQIVKQKQTHWTDPTSTTTVEEYQMGSPAISGATAIISGRYPQKGYAVNKKSTEMALVISGGGYVGTPRKKTPIVLGDCILIRPNEKFFWQGHMALFMACTPRWNQKQHHFV